MRKITPLSLATLVLLVTVAQAAPNSVARFGYYWRNNTLPYDTKFSYFFDVAVYPDGIFADCQEHSWAYVTAQNKHITYDGVPYSVEVILQYGYWANNVNSIKRVWINGLDDPTRYTSWWIDSDADGHDFWDLSTLEANGYLTTEPDAEGDVLKFLRVRAETIFIDEATSPIQSTWRNRFYFYDPGTNQWDLKAKNSFTIPASRQAVRDATYLTGSGIWAGILETEGDDDGPPDYGKPPVKKVVYKNRWIRVVDQGATSTPNLDAANNWWIEPQSLFYKLFYRSQPIYFEFAAGSETISPCPTMRNGSFEDDGRIPAPWRGNKNLTLKDRRVCRTAHHGSCSFRMVGTSARKSLRQVVRISGSAGDSFTLRGWSKARNPLRKGGPYCLQAKVFHTDGTKKNYRACFAKRTHGWQRRKRTFTIAKDYNKIVVYLLYYKQGGKAWFDDVRLIAQ